MRNTVFILILMFAMSFGGFTQQDASNDNASDAIEKIINLEDQMELYRSDKTFKGLAKSMMAVYSHQKMSAALYDVTSGGTGNYYSSIIDTSRLVIADDFIVPSGEQWNITEVFAVGSLQSPSSIPNGALVEFYRDNNCEPGELLQTEFLSGTDAIFNTGDFMLNCADITLMPGRYWLAVAGYFPTSTSYTNDGWNWVGNFNTPVGCEFRYEDSDSLRFSSTVVERWFKPAEIGLSDASMAFILNGTSSQTIPTMGEWSLIILVNLILIIGVIVMRSRIVNLV